MFVLIQYFILLPHTPHPTFPLFPQTITLDTKLIHKQTKNTHTDPLLMANRSTVFQIIHIVATWALHFQRI